MECNLKISGFADEICSDFAQQLEVVKSLGMEYISLRSANGKNIAKYTVEEVKETILPVLKQYGIKVSSIGSPIGKVDVEDEEGFQRQLQQLKTLCEICKLLDTTYIRIFSFFIPEGKDPENDKELVFEKLTKFKEVAEAYDVVLIHENEKDIYGDTAVRCKEIMDRFRGPHFRFAFDFANFVQCGEEPQKCWELLKEDVAYIHIKDAVYDSKENVVFGTGDGQVQKILEEAIVQEGYRGFLTLEPHLVVFDSLSTLEKSEADQVRLRNKAKTGAEGYAMQYEALGNILRSIKEKGEGR